VRVDICEAASEQYSIAVVLEAWDKDDPRAVAAFYAEVEVEGRAFPHTIILHRVPFFGLTRYRATKIFDGLMEFIHKRIRSDRKPAKARSGNPPWVPNEIPPLAIFDRRPERAKPRRSAKGKFR